MTGKAYENGQNSGERGGNSPWTRPSATFRLDPGWGSYSKTAPGSPSTGSPAGRSLLLKKRRDSMYSQAYVRA